MKLTSHLQELLSTSSTIKEVGEAIKEAFVSEAIKRFNEDQRLVMGKYPVFRVKIPYWVANEWGINPNEFLAQEKILTPKREYYGTKEDPETLSISCFSTVPTDFQILFKGKNLPNEVLESMQITEVALTEEEKPFKISIVEEL